MSNSKCNMRVANHKTLHFAEKAIEVISFGKNQRLFGV